jgi:hypothetical protein
MKHNGLGMKEKRHGMHDFGNEMTPIGQQLKSRIMNSKSDKV